MPPTRSSSWPPVAAQAAVALEHGRLYGVLRAKGDVRRRLLDQTLQAQEAERKALVLMVCSTAPCRTSLL